MQVGRGSGTTGLTWLLSDHPSLHSGQALGSTSITADGATIAYVGNYYEWSGSTGTSYYYAGSMRVAMRQGGTLYYLFGDHLGSTSVVATSSGSKSAEVRYRAWGEDRFASGTAPTSFRFTGQRVETSLGLYFYGARWYDASLGRFLSPDSVVPDVAQGVQAWDRYAFVSNNPLKYIDPTGHNAVRSMSFGEEPPPPHKPTTTPRPSPASPQDIFKSQQTPTPQGPVYQPGPTSTATPSTPFSSFQSENFASDIFNNINWDKVDKIDAAIDGFGLACNIAEIFVPGADVVGAVPEGVGFVKSLVEVVTGNPKSMLIQQTTNQTERVAVLVFRAERMSPFVGFVGNGFSLYINFRDAITIKP